MLQIFRAGKHAEQLTPAVLAATVAAYDPKKHEAPIVIGHPNDDAPAYGWVNKLSFDKKTQSLNAEPAQVDPTFAEAVAAGRYKKISASFYPPTHPANPVPDTYYLRHVGFLGAQVPVVKGMPAVQFADADADGDILTVEFGEEEISPWVVGNIAKLFRRIRDFIIADKGVDEADKMLSDWDIKSIEEEEGRLRAEQDKNTNQFNEDPIMTDKNTTEFAEREAELAKREAAIKAQEDAIAESTAEASQKEAVDFAENLVKAGKILPRDQQLVADLITSQPDDLTVNFAEGDAKPVPTEIKKVLCQFLEALPPQVDFSEISAADEGNAAGAHTVVPVGYQVAAGDLDKDQKIINYAEKNSMTYIEALQALDAKGALQSSGGAE